MSRRENIEKFYKILDKLRTRTGGERYLKCCDGNMNWPKRGVYFFFEEGETRESSNKLRVVRIGTHAVRNGSQATLWNRLRAHRGSIRGRYGDGGGNHRGSVFRRHVGDALIKKRHLQYQYPTWSKKHSVPASARMEEYPLEVKVSQKIGNMPFLWLEANDAPGANSIRRTIEKNSVALLSNYERERIDASSRNWLGGYCSNELVKKSGLWNVDYTDKDYDPEFLSRMNNLMESV